MQDTLQTTHTTLLTLKAQEAFGTTAVPSVVTTASDWRTSITQHAITCLECGQTFKQLNGRHLREHGLDGRSYRAKYGIPTTQPLSARATTALRRRIAAETRPWETAPTYVKAQQEKAATAKKSGKKGTRK
jgi:predicted transcriptional regulator